MTENATEAELSELDTALEDVSLHRVWWRWHWMIWLGDPHALEKHRPWTHHVPIALLVGIPLLLGRVAKPIGGWLRG